MKYILIALLFLGCTKTLEHVPDDLRFSCAGSELHWSWNEELVIFGAGGDDDGTITTFEWSTITDSLSNNKIK